MKTGDLVAGRYRLLRPIGAGAMATVWAARHELLGKEFALKLAVLPPRADADARTRFLREAQIIARLRHPNVVDVADVGEVAPGAPQVGLYIAMELLDGMSLAQHIELRGCLTAREAVMVATEVAGGLSAAHHLGVVHRDVKPENVFLARGPNGGLVPKLLDFGVSKARHDADVLATASGQLFGTPAYMSPEQALGELDVDHRTDIWSLGVVLYEMLSGRHPFVAPNYQALLPRIAEQAHAPLDGDAPPAVVAIVERCLAKRREDRWPSAEALGEALEEALATLEEDDSELTIERPIVRHSAMGTPSQPDGRLRGPLGTLSPSMRAVPLRPTRHLTMGLALGAAAVIGAGVALWRARAVDAQPAAPTSAATALAAQTGAPASASLPQSEPPREPEPITIELPDEADPAATAAPSISPSASAAASAPRKSKPASAPRKAPVTGVNSAGF